MSLLDKKITGYTDSVSALSVYPSDDGVTADELRRIFDSRTDNEIPEKFNGLIDALMKENAASELGAVGGTVQEALDLKVSKEEGKALSSEDYTSEEKNKLSGIADGAQVNTVNSVAGKTGNVELSKSDVGLSNVDNTSDEDKPVSKVQREAIAEKAPKKNPEFTGVLDVEGVMIYREDGELMPDGSPTLGALVIEIPWHGQGYPPMKFRIGNGGLSYVDLSGNHHEVYHEGNLLDLTRPGNYLGDVDKYHFLDNTGLLKEVETEKLKIDGVEIHYDEESASFFICVPAGETEWHVPYMPTTVDLSNGEMRINNETVFHSGNLKNLAWAGQQLDDVTEKAMFMANTGLDKIIGDIETALDSIIAMQNTLIGGDA